METEEEKQILEDYKIWKKNSPFLYEIVVSQVLEWPSLTIQWMPEVSSVNENDNRHSLLLGTHTKNEQNYLMLASLDLPETNVRTDESQYQPEQKEFGGFGSTSGRFNVNIKICHEGEVNRARYMPQNPSVIATRGPFNDVLLFDYTKHPCKPEVGQGCQPDLRLSAHTAEGYGLAWNAFKQGHVLTCADDGAICVWDVESNTAGGESSNVIAPSVKFDASSRRGVHAEDICWHTFSEDVFLAGLSDGSFSVFDVRANNNNNSKGSNNYKGHELSVYAIAYNNFSSHVFATGSEDKTIGLWDMRYISNEPVMRLKSMFGEVTQVQWSPFKDSILASCGSERKVNIYDLCVVNENQDQVVYKDVGLQPELIFVHGGHTSKVNDISWNLNEPLMMCTVAADNVMQIWQMIYEVNEDGQPTGLYYQNGAGDEEAPPVKRPNSEVASNNEAPKMAKI